MSNCGLCGLGKQTLTGKIYAVKVCRRCDTSAQGSGMRVGPPSLPDTRDGWFTPPFGDTK